MTAIVTKSQGDIFRERFFYLGKAVVV